MRLAVKFRADKQVKESENVYIRMTLLFLYNYVPPHHDYRFPELVTFSFLLEILLLLFQCHQGNIGKMLEPLYYVSPQAAYNY